jgi:hypothetical protein
MYTVGLHKTRMARDLNAMLWVSCVFGGRRTIASCLSDLVTYRRPFVSGRSGNVNCRDVRKVGPTLSRPLASHFVPHKSKHSNGNTHKAICKLYLAPKACTRSVKSLHTNDKGPLPAFQATRSLCRLVHRSHHKASKHATELTYRCEDSSSFGHL